MTGDWDTAAIGGWQVREGEVGERGRAVGWFGQ